MEDQQPRLELTGSRLFTAWLARAKASLAFTTYLFLIGLKAGRPALDLRAHLLPLHGTRHRVGWCVVNVLALLALAPGGLPQTRRHRGRSPYQYGLFDQPI